MNLSGSKYNFRVHIFYFKVKYLKYEYKVKYEENLNALSRVLKLNQTGVTHIDCKYLQSVRLTHYSPVFLFYTT